MSAPGDTGAEWLAGGAGIVRESMLAIGDRIVEAVETRLVPPGAPPVGDALLDGVPVLSRREAWIVPLSTGPMGTEHRQRASELWRGIRIACEFRHGNGLSIDLAGARPNAYVAALLAQDVRRADWWASGGRALVLVTEGAPVTASALHVVPLGWVSRTSPSRRIRDVDLSWERASG
ncbi:hypothetical protein [Microbacterium oleivorans]|uniref:hypothetical protein n=1 Tax=Microbacterium oleivorans TaxID=273677 RepID=UPI00080DE395|nr:hypothetical protein [Microbacterium oleivorans]